MNWARVFLGERAWKLVKVKNVAKLNVLLHTRECTTEEQGFSPWNDAEAEISNSVSPGLDPAHSSYFTSSALCKQSSLLRACLPCTCLAQAQRHVCGLS